MSRSAEHGSELFPVRRILLCELLLSLFNHVRDSFLLCLWSWYEKLVFLYLLLHRFYSLQVISLFVLQFLLNKLLKVHETLVFWTRFKSFAVQFFNTFRNLLVSREAFKLNKFLLKFDLIQHLCRVHLTRASSLVLFIQFISCHLFFHCWYFKIEVCIRVFAVMAFSRTNGTVTISHCGARFFRCRRNNKTFLMACSIAGQAIRDKFSRVSGLLFDFWFIYLYRVVCICCFLDRELFNLFL